MARYTLVPSRAALNPPPAPNTAGSRYSLVPNTSQAASSASANPLGRFTPITTGPTEARPGMPQTSAGPPSWLAPFASAARLAGSSAGSPVGGSIGLGLAPLGIWSTLANPNTSDTQKGLGVLGQSAGAIRSASQIPALANSIPGLSAAGGASVAGIPVLSALAGVANIGSIAAGEGSTSQKAGQSMDVALQTAIPAFGALRGALGLGMGIFNVLGGHSFFGSPLRPTPYPWGDWLPYEQTTPERRAWYDALVAKNTFQPLSDTSGIPYSDLLSYHSANTSLTPEQTVSAYQLLPHPEQMSPEGIVAAIQQYVPPPEPAQPRPVPQEWQPF